MYLKAFTIICSMILCIAPDLVFGQCKPLTIIDCETLCSYSNTELEQFGTKAGFKVTSGYSPIVLMECKSDPMNYIGIKNQSVNLFHKLTSFKDNFIKSILSKGYSYTESGNYGDGYESDKFYVMIREEDNEPYGYHILVAKKQNNESEKNIKKVFAKRFSPSHLEIDSYSNTTDISIQKGDSIRITASGSITYGSWAGSGGPDGIDGYTSYNRISGFRHGSLLVRIGDNGEWQAVGKLKSIVANNNGALQFIVNDVDPSNNSGFFTIELKITKSE